MFAASISIGWHKEHNLQSIRTKNNYKNSIEDHQNITKYLLKYYSLKYYKLFL